MRRYTTLSQKENDMICELCRKIDEISVAYERDVSLKQYNSFRIDSRAKLGIFPRSSGELAEAVSVLEEYGQRYEICGNCSNILFGDGELDLAIIFTEGLCNISVDGETITAEAGVTLSSLASKAAELSLTGLEFAKGIPGSVGGALFMNAGAYGGAMSDVTASSVALDRRSGEISTITDHSFGYRESIYAARPELVCLLATFKLCKGNKDEINEKMRSFAEQRREKQPLNLPSAGSYFKRPEGSFAGKLIEDAGLKGRRVNDACVSEKHAGFIVNLGHASACDILKLEEAVRDEVYKRFGIRLEREVRFIR